MECAMMNFFTRIAPALVLSVAAAVAHASSDHGTRDEAVAMVRKAAAFYKANGKEKALAEFNNSKGQFVDRDLYVTAYDLKGTSLANGMNSKLVGKNMMDLKDMDGRYITRERLSIAKEKGKGWQEFKWVNPITKVIEPKSMYFELVDDLVIGCGVYTAEK
jgi:signal transduction histidine kinase